VASCAVQINTERERVSELQRQVAVMQDKVVKQRRKMGGINAAQQCNEQVGAKQQAPRESRKRSPDPVFLSVNTRDCRVTTKHQLAQTC
jgi:hypothetical protein